MTTEQQESLFTICLMAAFADGAKSEGERAELQRIADSVLGESLHAATIYQKVLLGQVTLEAAVQKLDQANLRALAYEMAVCVCDADDVASPAEKDFLSKLQAALGLEAGACRATEQTVEALAAPAPLTPAPLTPTPQGATPPALPDLDGMVLNYALVAAALELLPDSLATMAIVPMQMKMVYRIGKSHGIELDQGHIKEFAAAAGLGLTSQVVEGFARKLVKGFIGKAIGGGLVKKGADQLTSSAFSFATTYGLGQVAKAYYAGGRTLSGSQLKALFDQTTAQAKSLHQNYLPQIQDQATKLKGANLLDLVRGGDPSLLPTR
jgi:uncharacterized protein (DUF697 family)/tellurite resistance protein